ncbi:GNAT family N-acetyltransferase [Nocardioides sp. zg-1228]|uniref:GNAT family N-acetyltransferase n=1 Tax=Nocardioides sp. zg-1228 TaxID=2763008 RepID=UPI001643349C|nr:GNAT family N-acetyltransferase [Nocardioides sp. zg-1228]MBC2934053.1 N-acetyltransferase [Nocardioides sp. zg-1228]QSF58807.1 N-acetyltransferase [Nocardioides sp. zg-1228]
MIEQVALRDGTDAFVVPLERTDRATLAAEFDSLSPESQRRRFLAPVRHLSDAMLAHLVDDVDGINHIALVLCAETSPDVYDPVALARLVRYTDASEAADLAVTVKDAWQGRGVATALLSVLMRHRPAGVHRIVTEVLRDNPASLAMLRRLGRLSLRDDGSGVYSVVVELEPLSDEEATGEARPAATDAVAQAGRPAPPTAPPEEEARAPALVGDAEQRHALRTRDQVCPWFD